MKKVEHGKTFDRNAANPPAFEIFHNTVTEGYSEHWHTAIEIIMPTRGEYEVVVGKDSYNLKEGDIINVDMSTIKNGYFSDSSRMYCIGEVDPEWKRLVEVTKQAVEAGLEAIRPWGHLGDVGAAVNKVATDAGFSVVAEYGGHGIGNEFHEDPFVSFVAEAGTGPILVPGMCFTIEPMVNMGGAAIDMSDPNKWTVRTKDRKPTAQWEVQLVVTEDGYQLLSW